MSAGSSLATRSIVLWTNLTNPSARVGWGDPPATSMPRLPLALRYGMRAKLRAGWRHVPQKRFDQRVVTAGDGAAEVIIPLRGVEIDPGNLAEVRLD